MWSSRRLRVYLSIAMFAVPFGQIADDALFGTPLLFVALDLQPFCIGKLGERLGAFSVGVSFGAGVIAPAPGRAAMAFGAFRATGRKFPYLRAGGNYVSLDLSRHASSAPMGGPPGAFCVPFRG